VPYHVAVGGARGFEWRAVSAVLAAGLLGGFVAGILVMPGAPGHGPESAAASALTDTAPASYARRLPAVANPHPAPTSSMAPTTPTAPPVATVIPASLAVSTPAGTGSVADPTTETQVAQDLIVAINDQSKGGDTIATTADNVAMLVSWMDNEGGLWADNPLNTSLDAARYPHEFTTAGQDTGIPIFPSIQVGIAATATTLLSNHSYAGILAVLSEGTASCDAFARAVIESPWAASHYGGDPSRFCGASGGAGTVPVTTACLRVPGHGSHRAARMPGACGRRAVTAAGRHRTGATPRRPRSGAKAGASRHARAAPHGAAVHHAAPHRPARHRMATQAVARQGQRRSWRGTGSSPRRLR
jgi:hypothetical protein